MRECTVLFASRYNFDAKSLDISKQKSCKKNLTILPFNVFRIFISDLQSCFGGDLSNFTIDNSLIDLFFAGIESTASSLILLILQLLHHPDVQETARNEIDFVIIFLIFYFHI